MLKEVTAMQIDKVRWLRLRNELARLRLIFAAQPEIHQVHVFGSFATQQTHAWSDLDIAVIADSDLPFIQRSVQIARLVQPQVGIQFLVYTPAEMQALQTRPFVKVEILEKGKTMPLQPQVEAQRWLNFANEDLRMAKLALGEQIFNQVCFHAQQCVEKCLKAALAAAGELLPPTHLLTDLFALLPNSVQQQLATLKEEILVLDQFYIPTRYPDALPGALPDGLPQQQDAQTALGTAQNCYQLVEMLVAHSTAQAAQKGK